jgi:hypothetical protein
MGAALGQRHDVVHLLGGCQLTGLLAPLTQRVRRDIPVADALPRPAIAFAGGRVALIFVVPRVHFLLVLIAVPAVRQRRAARIAAWPLGFPWHTATSRAKQKPSEQLLRRLFFCYADFVVTSIAPEKAKVVS